MRRMLSILVLVLVGVLLMTSVAAAAKPQRRTPVPIPEPTPTSVPTPIAALSPLPLPRDEYWCARVIATDGFESAKAMADAIARGEAVIVEVGPFGTGTALVATPTPARRPTSRPTPTPASATTHTWAEDRTLTRRWLEGSEFSCDFEDAACWGMLVTASAGCPGGLYGEVTVLDGSKTAIGYTNDVVGALQPGQQARLVFESFESGAMYAQPSGLNCRR